MKKILFAISCLLLFSYQSFSQANIAAARAMPVGSTVTIRGVVTNGSELGLVRYIQDATGGIAAYGSLSGASLRGDSIVLTGVTKDYNKLLEIDPVTAFTAIAPGKPMPDPKIITPDQMTEIYEAQIVEIKNATFALAGGTFAGNTNYNITASGQTAQVRVNSASPLVGQLIPSGSVHIVGICSQFSYSSPTTGYQLLLRDGNDILPTSSVSFTSPVVVSSITTTGFVLDWETNVAGTTEIFYGNTPSLELGHSSASGIGTTHNIPVGNGSPSQLFYVKAFTVAGSDTGFSGVKVVITNSVSSGDMKIYFTGTVDNSVSTGTNAIQINDAVDDTCMAYINRAKYTIDLAMYNFSLTGLSNIASSLNAANARGVVVRVVADGSTANTGMEALNGNIKKIARPAGDGIMHNKFMIIDANSANANDPIVWTGSCNWTNNNVNIDANNVLFIQDKSLAAIYKIEFEEMFGSTTATPNAAQAKFGAAKSENTPHEITIGNKRVEIYFSPSDAVNGQLIAHINTANNDLEVATMLMTRSDVGSAIAARAAAGAAGQVVVNDTNYQTYNTLKTALGDSYRQYGESGILHSKYLIVDQSNPASDPLVWTGSHNWSSAADQKNDENTLVIHDATVANIYYQEFVQRYNAADPIGSLHILNLGPDQDVCGDQVVILDAGIFTNYNWSTGDIGVKTIEVDSSGVGFGTKKIYCRVTDANGTQSDTVYITFKDCTGIHENTTGMTGISVYPNPSNGSFTLKFTNIRNEQVELILTSLDGREIWKSSVATIKGENRISAGKSETHSGLYLLRIKNNSGESSLKILVK